MRDGFDPDWLAIREPFDDRALDRGAIGEIEAWLASREGAQPIRMVDLGCGTGAALRRASRWLRRGSIEAFSVDCDRRVLAHGPRAWAGEAGADVRPLNGERSNETIGPYAVRLGGKRLLVTPLLGDALDPLAPIGGPLDGTIDLLLAHAVVDLLPLDRLAARVAALLKPDGLAHIALAYDGTTSFQPIGDRALDARVMAAYHRHMDRHRATIPSYGGSRAGRRLAAELERAGLEVVRVARSVWTTGRRRAREPNGYALLDRMLGFVVGSVLELGQPPARDTRRWEASRRALLDTGQLRLRVGHVDTLARRPFRAGGG